MKNPILFARTLVGTSVLWLATVAAASAQTVLAQIPIPLSSNGEMAANPALNLVYSASGDLFGGTLSVIDGHSLTVATTISNNGGSLNGISVDPDTDNYWTTDLYGGQIVTYSSANAQIFANAVGYCPDGVSFDCKRRRVWAGAQCGAGNDPLFVFDADSFALIAGPIGTGGVMGVIRVNPVTGKLYVTEGTVSKEVNPTTFAVTTTGFGNVEAIDSFTNRLFAVQETDLQVVSGRSDKVIKSVTLSYTPELFITPAPLKVNGTNASAVIVKAFAPTSKPIAFTATSSAIETAVALLAPKMAIAPGPVGTLAGLQLLAVFQSPEPGLRFHVTLAGYTSWIELKTKNTNHRC